MSPSRTPTSTCSLLLAKLRRAAPIALLLAWLLGGPVGSAHAVSFSLGLHTGPGGTLTPLIAPGESEGTLVASPGSNVTLVVGVDGAEEIFAYTLDLEWDPDEITLVGSEQLACDPAGSLCTPVAFTAGLDGLAGRASVLSFDVLSTQGDADGPPGLFALTLEVPAVFADGQPDLVIGFLDAAADALTAPDSRGVPVNLTPEPDRIRLAIVPEPTTAALLGLGLLALARRRRPWRAGALLRSVGLLLGLAPALALLAPPPAVAAVPTCDPAGEPSTCDEPAEKATQRCICREKLLLGSEPQDLVDADIACNQAFEDGFATAEEEEETRLLRAWTRVLRALGGNEAVLFPPGVVTDSFVEMMDAFDIDQGGRNLYAWRADLPREFDFLTMDSLVTLPDTSPDGSEFQQALVGILALPLGSSILDDTIADLRAIPERTVDDFIMTLCEPEYGTIEKAIATGFPWLDDDLALFVDWGDAKIMEMGFLLWKAQLLQYYAQDSQLDLQSYTPWRSAPRIQTEVVEANEDLLTLRADRTAALEEAGQASREATDAYFEGTRFIRTQGIREAQVFRIDQIGGDPMNELEVREHVAAFGTILDRPAIVLEPVAGDFINESRVIGSIGNEFDFDLDPSGGVVVDLGLLYDSQPFGLRDVIPVFGSDNGVKSGRLIAGGSYPDRAFRGGFVPPALEDDKASFLACFDQAIGFGVGPIEDPTCEASDIDGDGFVGAPDFTYLLVGLGATSADPAPPLCGLGFELALALPILRRWRRRRLEAA